MNHFCHVIVGARKLTIVFFPQGLGSDVHKISPTETKKKVKKNANLKVQMLLVILDDYREANDATTSSTICYFYLCNY